MAKRPLDNELLEPEMTKFNPRITMRVLTTEGVQDVVVPDPFERSLVGTHWNAIERYLGGDPSALRSLHADIVDSPIPTIAGKQLLFDEREIDWYASRGQTSGFELYTENDS